MSRRSHRYNRDADDDLYGNRAPPDTSSSSHSGYGAGSSYTQHGSYDYGHGGSSYTAQSSYSRGDPNHGHLQQQQYQEQYGGYGSQASQGYGSEEESVRSSILSPKKQTVGSTENALYAAQGAEVSGLGTLGYLSTQGERLHNTEKNLDIASSRNRIAEEKAQELKRLNGSMFVPSVGDGHRLERGERNRAIGFSRRDLAEKSRYQFEGDSDMGGEDEHPGQESRPAFVELSRRVLREF